jgi:putative phosphoribosyl transferase
MSITTLSIRAGRATLTGDLDVPEVPSGLVVFAHGSGSSRLSPRNRAVADSLAHEGFATLLFDLLTPDEELAERTTRHLRFDIPLLAQRLVDTLEWIDHQPQVAHLPIGLFGASTGAAAALIASVHVRHADVQAVVSRGGRPDLAGGVLAQVSAPTLLIVGGDDVDVLALNRLALARITAPAALHVVPDAGHLFEEPGALREVAGCAVRWFHKYLSTTHRQHQIHI